MKGKYDFKITKPVSTYLCLLFVTFIPFNFLTMAVSQVTCLGFPALYHLRRRPSCSWRGVRGVENFVTEET